MSRTLSGLFLVGALNKPRKRYGTNRENPRTIPEQKGKIPEKSGKSQKGQKRKDESRSGNPPLCQHRKTPKSPLSLVVRAVYNPRLRYTLSRRAVTLRFFFMRHNPIALYPSASPTPHPSKPHRCDMPQAKTEVALQFSESCAAEVALQHSLSLQCRNHLHQKLHCSRGKAALQHSKMRRCKKVAFSCSTADIRPPQLLWFLP